MNKMYGYGLDKPTYNVNTNKNAVGDNDGELVVFTHESMYMLYHYVNLTARITKHAIWSSHDGR